MSGTKGQVIKRKLEAKEKAEAQAASIAQLRDNQDAVMARLTGVVKTAAGWTEIEEPFQQVVNQSLAGGIIDLDELDNLIEQWEAGNVQPTE